MAPKFGDLHSRSNTWDKFVAFHERRPCSTSDNACNCHIPGKHQLGMFGAKLRLARHCTEQPTFNVCEPIMITVVCCLNNLGTSIHSKCQHSLPRQYLTAKYQDLIRIAVAFSEGWSTPASLVDKHLAGCEVHQSLAVKAGAIQHTFVIFPCNHSVCTLPCMPCCEAEHHSSM